MTTCTLWIRVGYGERRVARRLAKRYPELKVGSGLVSVTGVLAPRERFDDYRLTVPSGAVYTFPSGHVELVEQAADE
ncbi:hypothetical protein ACXYTP_24950 [Tsukamurella ocularis]